VTETILKCSSTFAERSLRYDAATGCASKGSLFQSQGFDASKKNESRRIEETKDHGVDTPRRGWKLNKLQLPSEPQRKKPRCHCCDKEGKWTQNCPTFRKMSVKQRRRSARTRGCTLSVWTNTKKDRSVTCQQRSGSAHKDARNSITHSCVRNTPGTRRTKTVRRKATREELRQWQFQHLGKQPGGWFRPARK